MTAIPIRAVTREDASALWSVCCERRASIERMRDDRVRDGLEVADLDQRIEHLRYLCELTYRWTYDPDD